MGLILDMLIVVKEQGGKSRKASAVRGNFYDD